MFRFGFEGSSIFGFVSRDFILVFRDEPYSVRSGNIVRIKI